MKGQVLQLREKFVIYALYIVWGMRYNDHATTFAWAGLCCAQAEYLR